MSQRFAIQQDPITGKSALTAVVGDLFREKLNPLVTDRLIREDVC